MAAGERALDAALVTDSPTPSAHFDAAFHALLEVEALLDADDPQPSAGFDAAFKARLAADGESRLDALLTLDDPRPSAGFDAAVKAGLADADRGAKVLPFGRIAWIAVPLAAAAALIFWLRPVPVEPESLPAEPALAAASQIEMLDDLELLEHLDEIAVLDGLEDPEIFAMVAQLDTLELDPLPEPTP